MDLDRRSRASRRVGQEAPDPAALFSAYRRSGDIRVRNQLVTHHQWLVHRCARRFDHRGEQLADLEQVAQIGLIKAVERFDPGRGVAFPTYAVPTMVGEIKRHFRDATWAVSVSRQSKELRTRIQQVTEELGQHHRRPPTAGEVGDELGVDTEVVEETIAANRAFRPLSIDQSRSSSGDALESEVARRSGWLPPVTETAEQRVEVLRALAMLDERNQKIMLWRFFEDRTQSEIGDRLGVGQVQVSRLLRSALSNLSEQLDDRAAV